MKVKELIEKLKEFDPELTVTYSDSEYGTHTVTDVSISPDAYVYWDRATVLTLNGEYIEKKHVDPKYFRKVERPVHKPSSLMNLLDEELKVIYSESIPKGTRLFLGNPPPNKDGVVEFKSIKDRDAGS